MGGFVCLRKTLKKKKKKKELERYKNSKTGNGNVVPCNCEWEIETGYVIAYGLAILEVKRIFLLVLGLFSQWNIILFAGGIIPLSLIVVSAFFGVPTSLGIVFAIYKRRQKPCFPYLKNYLKYLSIIIIFCAILNIIVMVSITIYLKISPDAISRIFNTSMILYSEETWHKVTIDEFQFTFQCCGHTKYKDWMTLDWQKVDYASREEMSDQRRISDEEFRPMAVPFSCCNLHTMRPCFHMDLSMNRENSVNKNGCSEPISRIILRSTAVIYCVSIFLVFTQILLTFIVVKIVKRTFPFKCPSICDCIEKCPSVCPLLESTTSFASSNDGYTSSNDENSSSTKIRDDGHLSKISSRTTGWYSSSSPSPSPPSSSIPKKSVLKNSSGKARCSGGCGGSTGAARIRPSLHTEHRVPKKRCCQKRTGIRPY